MQPRLGDLVEPQGLPSGEAKVVQPPDAAGVFGTARSIEADFDTRMGKLRAGHPEVLVRNRVEQGAPRSALLAAAYQGQLLVIGARGRGGLREMALGSVSLAVLQHATCPVTVVHKAASPRREQISEQSRRSQRWRDLGL